MSVSTVVTVFLFTLSPAAMANLRLATAKGYLKLVKEKKSVNLSFSGYCQLALVAQVGHPFVYIRIYALADNDSVNHYRMRVMRSGGGSCRNCRRDSFPVSYQYLLWPFCVCTETIVTEL